MNRIIINNKSNLSDIEAINIVGIVINTGRCSNNKKQYCYLTSIKKEGVWYQVSTQLNKKSDSFTIF